ncbi:MAG: N-6 DNA methylase [Pseudomonadales bacterium]|nr:N-6 DNA methylase [Pseudomonadales bacterium]
MAKSKNKTKALEEILYNDIAKTLRGVVEAAEYKHVTLPLLFLKFVSDKFELQREKLTNEGKTKFIEMKEFYQKDNVFYLIEESRWSYIVKNAKSSDISIKLDTALNNIEKNNPSLKGALPDNYYSRLNLSSSKIAALIDHINNNIHIGDESFDLMGRIYEYFLQKFAVLEGKGKGEFYTPKSTVNLIAEMIEPYSGKIYDPCCGSGGMFVQSLKFIEAHKGDTKKVAVFGQESIDTTYRLAKMNLALRGISGNLGKTNADTFANDQHKDLKADYVMANPPFNQKDWRAESELKDDPRWAGYDVPPVSNANYAWILNIVSKLSVNGTAGFLLANGALSDSDTRNIRRRLIENNLVEAIIVLPRNTFYSTDISVTLWILSKNKKARDVQVGDDNRKLRDREREILFMDLRTWGSEFEKKYIELTPEDISKASNILHSWQEVDGDYQDIPETCRGVSFDEIKNNDFSLVPSKYIEFVDRDNTIDFDKEMKRIQKDMSKILSEETTAEKELREAFKGLGYEI